MGGKEWKGRKDRKKRNNEWQEWMKRKGEGRRQEGCGRLLFFLLYMPKQIHCTLLLQNVILLCDTQYNIALVQICTNTTYYVSVHIIYSV